MRIFAYAKANLSLDVLRKRDDGYHDLRMVAQTLSLYDEIDIELTGGAEITVTCNFDFIPTDGRNLAAAAAKLFSERTGSERAGVRIDIKKSIPVCAGLGGGSANAAAVLRGLNALLDAKFSDMELREMALLLGSDVPFCVNGGTQLMEGRGEILTPLPPLPDCRVVVCKPNKLISTQAVFGWIKAEKIKYHPDNDGMIKALGRGSLTDVGRRMYNALEDTVAEKIPEIPLIREAFLDGGAIGSCMTGTGTAVIGLFGDVRAAERTAEKLSRLYAETFMTEPVAGGAGQKPYPRKK